MFIKSITNDVYPKTLEIRNTSGGMIWQIYHVNNLSEAEQLAANSLKNGFMESTLVDHRADEEETYPDWREDKKNTIIS